MDSIVFCSLITLILLKNANSFPQGGSTESCDSLLPRHRGTEPIGPEKSPYYIVQSSSKYGDDGYGNQLNAVKVELGGAPFKGFFLAAVDPLTGNRIGHWVKFKGTDTLPCSVITHSNARLKKFASLIWVPPAHTNGYVAFEGTVVKSFSEYYSGLVSVLPHQLNKLTHGPPEQSVH